MVSEARTIPRCGSARASRIHPGNVSYTMPRRGVLPRLRHLLRNSFHIQMHGRKILETVWRPSAALFPISVINVNRGEILLFRSPDHRITRSPDLLSLPSLPSLRGPALHHSFHRKSTALCHPWAAGKLKAVRDGGCYGSVRAGEN